MAWDSTRQTWDSSARHGTFSVSVSTGRRGCSHRHKLLPWWHFCLVSLSALFLSGYFRPNSSPFIPDYFQLLLPESSQGSPPQGMIQNTLLQQLCDAQHSFAGFTETVQPTAHTSPVTQSRGLLVQVGKPRHREHDPQAG